MGVRASEPPRTWLRWARALLTWKRNDAGGHGGAAKVFSFESMDAFLQVLSPERYRLLRHADGRG
jgi:predicted transcriptional regulator